MDVNYVSRDTYGMYKNSQKGPGPLMGADTLLGNDVYNLRDEKLGTIKEFMIDMSTGRIAYAVLSYGGFLGMGDRLFAVPWQALKLDTVNHRFNLNVDKELLKDAPGFDKDHWPSMADPTWATGVHKFYGMTYRQERSADTLSERERDPRIQ
jgi:sporulation protein YlmC with PRC-barrel domain